MESVCEKTLFTFSAEGAQKMSNRANRIDDSAVHLAGLEALKQVLFVIEPQLAGQTLLELVIKLLKPVGCLPPNPFILGVRLTFVL